MEVMLKYRTSRKIPGKLSKPLIASCIVIWRRSCIKTDIFFMLYGKCPFKKSQHVFRTTKGIFVPGYAAILYKKITIQFFTGVNALTYNRWMPSDSNSSHWLMARWAKNQWKFSGTLKASKIMNQCLTMIGWLACGVGKAASSSSSVSGGGGLGGVALSVGSGGRGGAPPSIKHVYN